MELDWSTFFLEIVNFLVLVWILKRFLYRPVLDFVARRRAETEEAIAASRRAQEEAEDLKRQYENRLSDWNKERAAALTQLRRDMDKERSTRLAEIRKALEEEREKARVTEERRQKEFRDGAEQEALTLATRFAGRVLERTSGPESTRALVALVAEAIGALAEDQRRLLLQAGEQSAQGEIQTAHALDAQERQDLETALAALFATEVRWQWRVVPELLAGVVIALGSWVLAANVRDELQGFASLSRGTVV